MVKIAQEARAYALYQQVWSDMNFSSIYEKCLKEWCTAETFQDLIRLNIKFIKGQILSTSYYLGELNPETHSLVSGLLKLHELGMLTWQSQPYMEENGEPCQKPFISFLIASENKPEELIKRLNKESDINIFVYIL